MLPQPSRKLAVSVLLSTIVVFIGDIITPLGFAEAILYLLPLLLSSFLYDPRLPLRLAGASTVLVAAGFVLSPPGAPVAYAVLNRTLAVIVLWTAAFGLRRLIQDRIAHLQAEYRWQLLAHQTHDILWDWNMLTNDHWWSENAIEIFGYDPYMKLRSTPGNPGSTRRTAAGYSPESMPRSSRGNPAGRTNINSECATVPTTTFLTAGESSGMRQAPPFA